MTEVFENISLLSDIYDFDYSSATIYENMCRAEITAIMENDYSYVEEGFSDMLHSMGDAIRKMIKAIKDFFVAFARAIKSYNMSLDNYVKKYKKELLEAHPDFSINGYDFNVLNSKDPDMSDFDKLVSTYNTALADIENADIDEFKKESQAFLSPTNLDEVRGRVLGNGGGLGETDFREEVIKFYRGSKSPVSLQITDTDVSEIVNHADTLIATTKKAMKDKDKIITLLSKAEIFFDRKVGSVYSSGSQTLGAISFNYDTDYKVSHTNSQTVATDDLIKKMNKLVSLKYDETKALSGIINIVISERANALRDMVKQERKILGKVLNPFGDKSDKATAVDESSYPTNYVGMAEEAMLILEGDMIQSKISAINREFNWIYECMDQGYVTDTIAMEGVIGTLIDRIAALLQNFLGIFRKKAKAETTKLSPWFKDNPDLEKIVSNNAKTMEFDMIPLWDGKWQQDMTALTSLLNDVVRKPTDLTMCPWASHFITYNSMEDLRAESTKDRNNKLKNYFRVGQKNKDSIDVTTIGGNELVGVVTQMLEYLQNWEMTTNRFNTINNRVEQLSKANLETSLGLNSDSILLESKFYDTDLAFLMEADNSPKANGGPAGQQPTNTSTTVRNDGNKDANAAVKDAKGNGQSVTKVVSRDLNGDGNNNGDNAENKSNSAEQEYYKAAIIFAKDVVTCFISVMEERYYEYRNRIFELSKEYKPVFDKDGKYVGTQSSKSENKESEGNNGNSNNGNVGKKKESFVNKAKNAVNTVASKVAQKTSQK